MVITNVVMMTYYGNAFRITGSFLRDTNGHQWISLTQDMRCRTFKQNGHCRPFNLLRPSDTYIRWKTNHLCFRISLVAWSVPSHYPNHCCNIVNWTLKNKLQWNFKWNSHIFFKENAFEMSSAKWRPFLPRPQCVNLTIVIRNQNWIIINAIAI